MVWERLGNLIENINERNTDLKVSLLLGVNLDKKFFPSIANIIGTDLSTYKIVRKGQFACKLMSVGRDGVLPLGFLEDYDEAIVSGAYYAFKVKDETIILPQYLMLCMSRKEFDRELWFRSGGDVRGGTSWEELCSIKIPIPTLEEQQQIVNSYKSIEERIKLKKQINDNLANTEEAILVETINKNICAPITFGDMVEFIDGDRGKNYPTFDEFTTSGYCLFLNTSNVTTNGFNFDTCVFVTKEKDKAMNKGHLLRNDIVFTSRGTLGNVALYDEHIRFENVRINSGMLIIRPKTKHISHYIIYSLLKSSFMKVAIEKYKSGSAQPQLPIKDLQKISFNLPQTAEILNNLDKQIKSIEEQISFNNQEIESLNKLSAILLAELSR